MKSRKLISMTAVIIIIATTAAISCVPSTAPPHDNEYDPENPVNLQNPDGGEIPLTFTVSFDSNGGTAVSDITGVEDGSTVTQPADPSWVYGTFSAWYSDEALTTPWNFSTDAVTGDLTLFAGWDELATGDAGPAGGIIFYDDWAGYDWDASGTIESDEKNLFAGKSLDGLRFLEVTDLYWLQTLSDPAEAGGKWSDPSEDIPGISNIINSETDRKSTVGEGLAYTNAIHTIYQGIQPGAAGERCYWYTGAGLEDWFMPSLGELYLMDKNRSTIGDMGSATYWCSSELDPYDGRAFTIDSTGAVYYSAKEATGNYIRPVRAF